MSLDRDEKEQVAALVQTLGSSATGIDILESIAAGHLPASMARRALEVVAVKGLYYTDQHRAREALGRLDAAEVDAVPRRIEGGR